MKFQISDEVIGMFPKVKIAVIRASSIDNTGFSQEIDLMLRETEKNIHDKFEGIFVSSDPTIAEWRKTYKIFGCKDLRSSIESLAGRVSKGKTLPNINKIVDLYNYISLKYFLPVGGEDMDKVEGNIVLRQADGDEEFIPLMETENNPPQKGEIIYIDDKDVICRAWNWREADRTKLTESTKRAVFVFESLLDNESERLSAAVSEFKTLITNYCGAKCDSFVLDKNNTISVEL